MNPVKVLIVEDEELYADKLEMLIDKLGYELTEVVDNSMDALQSITENTPDFILMDINIQGDYDGIELSEQIQSILKIPILFISSLQDDMTFKRIKRTNPVGFLVKPFDELQLQRTLELTVEKEVSDKTEPNESNVPLINEMLFVKTKNAYAKINPSDIIYLEADGKYSSIFLDNNRYVVRSSLIKLLEKLNTKLFFQTHRNYAVNLAHIEEIDINEQVVKAKGKDIPLSRRNKELLSQKLKTL